MTTQASDYSHSCAIREPSMPARVASSCRPHHCRLACAPGACRARHEGRSWLEHAQLTFWLGAYLPIGWMRDQRRKDYRQCCVPMPGAHTGESAILRVGDACSRVEGSAGALEEGNANKSKRRAATLGAHIAEAEQAAAAP